MKRRSTVGHTRCWTPGAGGQTGGSLRGYCRMLTQDTIVNVYCTAAADSLLVLPQPLTKQVVLSGLQTVSGSGRQMGATVLLMEC